MDRCLIGKTLIPDQLRQIGVHGISNSAIFSDAFDDAQFLFAVRVVQLGEDASNLEVDLMNHVGMGVATPGCIDSLDWNVGWTAWVAVGVWFEVNWRRVWNMHFRWYMLLLLPPTDWVSHFAPSAWTHESKMGGKHNQWYCHLFAPEQPDWNWDNREIEEDFLKTLKFWADRGVDGFRIDVAHGMVKEAGLPDIRIDPTAAMLGTEHKPFWDQEGVHDIYRSWRKIFD